MAKAAAVPDLLREPLLGQTLRRDTGPSEGGSLAPKEKPGAAPKLDEKAMRLLEDDIRGAPLR